MKAMKGRVLKKLKLINPTITTFKQGLILHLNHSHNQNTHTQLPVRRNIQNVYNPMADHQQVIKDDQKDEETESDYQNYLSSHGDQDDISEPSIEHCKDILEDNKSTADQDNENQSLPEFEEKCPPGGENTVIFYTTSLRGIRKTFEDCHSIRFLLESFRVTFHERDVSMDLEYREELWRILGGRVIPPRLFIKGKYIGGADEVVGLHEQGKLKKLLQGISGLGVYNGPCHGCGNIRFLVCSSCNGSRRIFADGEMMGAVRDHELCIRCPDCNENGLVKCPVCV